MHRHCCPHLLEMVERLQVKRLEYNAKMVEIERKQVPATAHSLCLPLSLDSASHARILPRCF